MCSVTVESTFLWMRAAAIKIRSKETERMFGIRVETPLRIEVSPSERGDRRGGIWICWACNNLRQLLPTWSVSGSGQFPTSSSSSSSSPQLLNPIVACISLRHLSPVQSSPVPYQHNPRCPCHAAPRSWFLSSPSSRVLPLSRFNVITRVRACGMGS